jgi:ubiquinone/menaquinone biosynthesis C-methylase UbiE
MPEPSGWERFVSGIYDQFLWLGERRGLRRVRGELLSTATGRTLEIGAGTGLNLAHYPSTVTRLLLTEPSPAMAGPLRRRASRHVANPSAAGTPDGPSVEVLVAPAGALPVPDASVDTVVSTLVLCTVPDPDVALAEIRRVLRPGGRLLFCEHVLAESPLLSSCQRALARPWAAFALGCRCDRALLDRISGTLELDRVRHLTWRGMPPLVRPLVVGAATR